MLEIKPLLGLPLDFPHTNLDFLYTNLVLSSIYNEVVVVSWKNTIGLPRLAMK